MNNPNLQEAPETAKKLYRSPTLSVILVEASKTGPGEANDGQTGVS